MTKNHIFVAVAFVIAAATAGWMFWTASVVPPAPEPVARHTPPAQAKGAAQTAQAQAKKQASVATPAPAAAVSASDSKVPHLVVPQEGLSLLYIVKCSACHGRDGKGPVGPSIAGKDYEENLAMLKKYKAGQVENTMMKDMLTRTPEADLEMLAREVASFK